MASKSTPDDLLRIALIVLAVVILLPLVTRLFVAPMMGMGMMGTGMMGGGTMGGYAPFWGLGMSLLWLVLLGGIGYVLYRRFGGQGLSTTTNTALEELRLAYARGDLSDEEFERRRAKLSRDDQSES